MRKSLIAFLVLSVLAAGGIAAAAHVLSGFHTAVEITEERRYGDPAAAEGLELGVETNLQGYLHWDTRIFPGQSLRWTTDFRYTALRDTGGSGEPQSYFNLYTLNGGGISYSGYDSLDTAENQEDPMTRLMADVASRAPEGEEDYRETVRLADYMDYYPLELDYYYNGVYAWPDGTNSMWPGVSEFFHVPVEEDVVTVSISKDREGEIYSTGWEQYQGATINCVSACTDGGIYLAVWGEYGDNGAGNPLREGAAETGVYWIPTYTTRDEYGNLIPKVDEEKVRLAWQPEDGVCVGLWLVDGGKKLLAQVSGSKSGMEMAVLDTATMAVEQEFPLDYPQSAWVQLFVEEDFVATYAINWLDSEDEEAQLRRQWAEAWYRGKDGRYEKVVSCDLRPGNTQWSGSITAWCDGERLVLAALGDDYYNPSVDLAICDGAGLQYAARLNHSQSWDSYYMDVVRPGNEVTVRSVGQE